MSVEFYDDNADSFIAQTASLDMQPLYQFFCGQLPNQASVLDAGCGSGRDALAFSQMGFDVMAFDASRKMVEAARELTGLPVYQMTFEQMQFDHRFDGIWACASLLHVPRDQLSDVLVRISSYLKQTGVLYASFKYGEEERTKDGRYFNDLNDDLLGRYLQAVPTLKLFQTWITTDRRPNRHDEKWLNCLISTNL